MNINEIKKALYKEKPIASLQDDTMFDFKVRKYKTYLAETSLGLVGFKVPLKEMGEKEFPDEIEAQLLIRWIV